MAHALLRRAWPGSLLAGFLVSLTAAGCYVDPQGFDPMMPVAPARLDGPAPVTMDAPAAPAASVDGLPPVSGSDASAPVDAAVAPGPALICAEALTICQPRGDGGA